MSTKTLLKGGLAEATANSSDLILDTASEIENLSEDKAIALVPELLGDIEYNSFRVGGVLAVIQDKGWFAGYDNFQTLVQDRFGLGVRKAKYLVSIYSTLVNEQISWDEVKHVGWTKLRVLVPVLKNDNVATWIKHAEECTVIQLEEMVKKAQTPNQKDGDEPITSTVSNMTFKVHEDQKATIKQAIEKSKASTSTEYDTVALEYICMGYLSGSVQESAPKGEEDLKTLFGDLGYERVLTLFDALWPEISLEVTIP